MKKLLIAIVTMSLFITACSTKNKNNTENEPLNNDTNGQISEESKDNNEEVDNADNIDKTSEDDNKDKMFQAVDIKTAEEAISKLKEGNNLYVENEYNQTYFPRNHRKDIAENGQKPYAVVLTCSDSRVPPEHIFSAGLGELFVIRTAGNVVNDFELGSVEYGVGALDAKVIVILGHTGCGAVSAAIAGKADGYIQNIVDEIRKGIKKETDLAAAEDLNIKYSKNKIMKSGIVKNLVDSGEVKIIRAKYDILTGVVNYYD